MKLFCACMLVCALMIIPFAAGADTVVRTLTGTSAHGSYVAFDVTIDFTATDDLVGRATRKGFKVVLAILGWGGLGRGQFWDTDEGGKKIPDRLDPFWPESDCGRPPAFVL